MKLSEKQMMFTLMIAKLVAWAYARGYGLTYGHAWRDAETQKRMVDRGLSKTLSSKHCDRLAVDFNLFIDGEYITDPEPWEPIGRHWEMLGGRWGGGFKTLKDANHFEYKEGG